MKTRTIVSLFVLTVLTVSSGLAQRTAPLRTGDGARERNGQSGVGVARISLITGNVSARRGPRGDLISAEHGLPLIAGDRVYTGPDSKVEIRFDARNYVRMDADGEVRLLQLGQSAYRLEVVRGRVSYSMLKRGLADVDLRSPGGTMVPAKEGIYRVDVRDTRTTFIVRKGEAEVLTPVRNAKLKSGKSMTVATGAPGGEIRVSGAPKKDPFDEWNKRRDKIIATRAGLDREPVWYPTTVWAGWGWGWPYYGGWWGPYPYFGYPYYGYPWRVGVVHHRVRRR